MSRMRLVALMSAFIVFAGVLAMPPAAEAARADEIVCDDGGEGQTFCSYSGEPTCDAHDCFAPKYACCTKNPRSCKCVP